MHFALTEDQIALRDAVRELLEAACPPAVVRDAWSTASESTVDAVWARLADMGVLGAAVPDRDGGLGLDERDLVPLFDEVGFAAVPLPVAETAGVAAPLLAAAGDPGGHLAGILAGDVRVALGGPLVPYGGRAHLVLTLDGGGARLSAPSGVPESTVDGSRALLRVDSPDGGLVVDDADLVKLATLRADLYTAAQLVGLARRMLTMTVGYVRERRQFGVPVGSFQAVKHQLADALLQLEFAAPAALAAAWALATGAGSAARDVSAATVLAVDAARTVARTAIQCHGAIGYTVEYDLHLFAKRAWALAATCDVDAHLDRLAGALGLTGTEAA